jgi:hypothetical protein
VELQPWTKEPLQPFAGSAAEDLRQDGKCLVPNKNEESDGNGKFGRPGDRGSIPGEGKGIFPLASVSRPALGPIQPHVQWVPGVLSTGVKARTGRDADHSPPSTAEVENE